MFGKGKGRTSRDGAKIKFLCIGDFAKSAGRKKPKGGGTGEEVPAGDDNLKDPR